MDLPPLLQDAYDLHVHTAPDVVPRAMDAWAVAASARQAGMAGIVLKDHAGSTAALAQLLNAGGSGGTRCFGSITLNPPSRKRGSALGLLSLRQGVAFNFGRILAAAGAYSSGRLVGFFQGDYAAACATITLIYLLGTAAIWLAPETKGKPLPE